MVHKTRVINFDELGRSLSQALEEPKVMMVLYGPSNPREVAEKWKSQYFNDGDGKWYCLETDNYFKDVHDLLNNLSLRCGREAINSIIGNDSWTTITCDTCGEYCTRVVHFKNPDCGTETNICKDCAINAYATLLDTEEQ